MPRFRSKAQSQEREPGPGKKRARLARSTGKKTDLSQYAVPSSGTSVSVALHFSSPARRTWATGRLKSAAVICPDPGTSREKVSEQRNRGRDIVSGMLICQQASVVSEKRRTFTDTSRRYSLMSNRPNRKLGSVPDVEFSKYPVQILFNRAFCQMQFVSDFLVRLTMLNETNDLCFAQTETPICGHAFCRPWFDAFPADPFVLARKKLFSTPAAVPNDVAGSQADPHNCFFVSC
jgi:hypothetical protein